MVARGSKESSKSPCLNVRVELDNRALKTKNNTLIQTVAKLQQDNAELLKQIAVLREESFEINSKYNNLKNVISIIDSTTKTCLPKLNEVAEVFTGILQLCNVAANVSAFQVTTTTPNKDVRTQAVKPQIVNGHILHNPTITLSRITNHNSDTPPRSNQIAIDAVRPSTSRVSEVTSNRDRPLNRSPEEENDSSSEENEEQDSYFVCRTSNSTQRKPAENNVNMARLRTDYDDSDEENEEPVGEENDEQSDQRLTTIHEVAEEEDTLMNNTSPRSRQRTILKGSLQEVRIYLNQLPNTYIEQFLGSGNISISVSPPERRSSYKHRSNSIVGDVNDSTIENGRLFLDDQLNCSRLTSGEVSFRDNLRLDKNTANINVSMKSPVPLGNSNYFEASSSSSNNFLGQFSESISAIQNMQTPTPARNETSSMQDTMQESTPIVPRLSEGTLTNRSGTYSPNRSKSDSLVFKSNITKRKTSSREKRKVAKVLLNRLSLEKRLSGSPIIGIDDVVNVIQKSSDLKTKSKGGPKSKKITKKNTNGANISSDEENLEKEGKAKGKAKRKKRDSPTIKISNPTVKPQIKPSSPTKSPMVRPKRAARPQTLKEPNLNKKMRRNK